MLAALNRAKCPRQLELQQKSPQGEVAGNSAMFTHHRSPSKSCLRFPIPCWGDTVRPDRVDGVLLINPREQRHLSRRSTACVAASPDPRLLQKPLMRERCCHCWPPALFTDTVWQHSTLSTVWLLWTRGGKKARKEVSQPLAPRSRTAIANAIIPAQPKRCETPRQTTLSSFQPNIWAAAATRAKPDARGMPWCCPQRGD